MISHHFSGLSWSQLTPAAYISSHFKDGSVVKKLPANAGDTGSIPGSGRSLEEEKATHSSILACRIPWTEEPGGL